MRWLFLFLISLSLFANDDPDTMQLPHSAVHKGDFFAYGKSVEIAGTVLGDLYAFGGQIYVDGTVSGDVIICGGSVNVRGEVQGNVRMLAGQATISGHVQGNVSLMAGNIDLGPSGVIDGNVIGIGGNIDISGLIKQNTRVYASNLRISNTILGNLKAYVGQLRLTSRAVVRGHIEYWSNNEAFVDPYAKVGEITEHPSFFYKAFQSTLVKGLKLGSKLATLLMNLVYTFVIGLILMKYFPKKLNVSIHAIKMHPVQSLLTGLIMLIVLPLVSLVLLISILGAPFALTLIALNVVGFYTVKIVFVLALLSYMKNFSHYKKLYFFFGLVCYFGLTLIPIAGWILSIGALLMGLGSLTLSKSIADN